jgi:uncharacterized membrane protein
MNGTNRRSLLPLLLIGAFACGGDSDADAGQAVDAPTTKTILAGHAVFGHEVRTIRPCGEDSTLWAIDSTQLTWDVHRELAPGMAPYEEVFVVVEGSPANSPQDGFGADYDGAFYVDRVLYAASEGWGCNLDLSRFQVRLSGNEPFWTLLITDSTAELSRMDGPGRTWREILVDTTDAGVRYRSDNGESGSLVVDLSDEPCRDSMSGAYHGYSASVVLAGEELTGCAIRGTTR